MATRRKPGPSRKKPLNQFGRDLLSALERSGKYPTQKALADAIGVDYQALYRYMSEGGPRVPGAVADAVRKALDASADEIRLPSPPGEALVRDVDEGYPGVAKFQRKHPDTKPRYVKELRAMAAKAGPDLFTVEACEALVAWFEARDAGKSPERPELTDDDD